jgi:hypothetical protein
MSTTKKPAAKASAKVAAKPAAKAPAKVAPKAAVRKPVVAAKAAPIAKAVISTEKRYKFLSGIDDSSFCQKVSDHLDAGYELHGSPTMTTKGSQIYVGQAVVLKKAPAKKKAKR